MSTLDSSNFDSSSGWTSVTTNATVVFNGVCTLTKTADGTNNGGFIRTAAITFVRPGYITFDLQFNATAVVASLYVFLSDEASLSTSFDTKAGMIIYNFSSTDHILLESTFGDIGDSPILPNTLYNIKFTINSNGTLGLYYKLSTNPSYTLVGTDETYDNGGSVSWIGRPIYFFCKADKNGSVVTMDNYLAIQNDPVTKEQNLDNFNFGMKEPYEKPNRMF